MDKKTSKGFTIIELMLVLSVIVMLTVALMPNIKNVRNKSREMSLRSSVFKMQALLETYYFDNEKYVQSGSMSAAELYSVFVRAGYINKVPKNPYTGNPFQVGDTFGKIVYKSVEDNYQLTAYASDGATVLVTVDGDG